jgi:hypothetical protein
MSYSDVYELWSGVVFDLRKMEAELTNADKMLGGDGVYITLESISGCGAYGSMSGCQLSWTVERTERDERLDDDAYVLKFLEEAVKVDTVGVQLENKTAANFIKYEKSASPSRTHNRTMSKQKSPNDIVEKWANCLCTEAVFISKKLTRMIACATTTGGGMDMPKFILAQYFPTITNWDVDETRLSTVTDYESRMKKRKILAIVAVPWSSSVSPSFSPTEALGDDNASPEPTSPGPGVSNDFPRRYAGFESLTPEPCELETTPSNTPTTTPGPSIVIPAWVNNPFYPRDPREFAPPPHRNVA